MVHRGVVRGVSVTETCNLGPSAAASSEWLLRAGGMWGLRPSVEMQLHPGCPRCGSVRCLQCRRQQAAEIAKQRPEWNTEKSQYRTSRALSWGVSSSSSCRVLLHPDSSFPRPQGTQISICSHPRKQEFSLHLYSFCTPEHFTPAGSAGVSSLS